MHRGELSGRMGQRIDETITKSPETPLLLFQPAVFLCMKTVFDSWSAPQVITTVPGEIHKLNLSQLLFVRLSLPASVSIVYLGKNVH